MAKYWNNNKAIWSHCSLSRKLLSSHSEKLTYLIFCLNGFLRQQQIGKYSPLSLLQHVTKIWAQHYVLWKSCWQSRGGDTIFAKAQCDHIWLLWQYYISLRQFLRGFWGLENLWTYFGKRWCVIGESFFIVNGQN